MLKYNLGDKMKDTVLFDLDGTLVDSLMDLADSVNYSMEMLGYNKRTLEEVRSFVGNGADMLIKRALPRDSQDFEKAIAIFKEYYNKNLCNKTKPYEGIVELLNSLKAENYKIAIVTNKPQKSAELIKDKLFKDNVDVVVGADTSLRRKKPYPDGVDFCLKLLESTRERAIFIGDSDVDILTAKNSSLYSIGVTWGFRDISYLEGADAIANNASELMEKIKKA